MKYKIRQAYDFYRRFIYNEELQVLLREHHIHVAGSVPSGHWELFGAILTGDDGKVGYGSDLEHHEVKSAQGRGGFEYQYHLHGGKRKLLDDMVVDHLFISYSPDYRDIDVRVMKGVALKKRFDGWMPGLIANYDGPNPKQRYRRSVSFGVVAKNGDLILQVRQGELVAVKRSAAKGVNSGNGSQSTPPPARTPHPRNRRALG